MPGGDRSGPAGAGPMTGRGMGYCVGRAPVAGGARMGRGVGYGGGFGRGYGAGGGFGRGYGAGAGRFGPVQPMTLQDERELLRMEEQQLSRNLADIKERLARLEAEKQ